MHRYNVPTKARLPLKKHIVRDIVNNESLHLMVFITLPLSHINGGRRKAFI